MFIIRPPDPLTGYQPNRHAAGGFLPDSEPELPPEGVLRGRVEALLADGQARISVAGRQVMLVPPRPLALGETVHLRITAREPRLVLEFDDATGEAVTELSTAGTLIARLATPGQPRPGLIPAPLPLLPSPPADGAAVAPLLARAVNESGLFYEAHQAEWVAGGRTTAQILAEPQARLPPAALPPGSTGRPASDPSSAGPQTAAGMLHTHPEALPLVRSQLDALESQRLLWSGELWPGQPAQWEISREEERRSSAGGAASAPATWQTRIRIELPRLGMLTAIVDTGSGGMNVRIVTATADAARALSAGAAEFRTALAAAGIGIAALDVAPGTAAEQGARRTAA